MKRFLRGTAAFLRQTDLWLLSASLLCAGFSLVLLYSIYRNGFLASSRPVWVQLAATVIGVLCAVFVSLIDYELLARFWKIHMAFAVFLVLLTFLFGIQREGADDRAWLNIGFTTIQPSEFLKISFIITFAHHLTKVGRELNRPKNLIPLFLHAGAVTGLIVVQGDFGTALIFAVIALTMLIMAGMTWKILLTGLIALPVVGFLVWNFVFEDLHRNRVIIAFNPELDPEGVGYQQMRGRMALGSGKLFGKGLFADDLTSVPEMRNDFIFSYIGQTLGLVGCLVAVGLLVLICFRALYVSRMSRDPLGNYICVGVFAFIFFQSAINIAMVLCVAPVIGVTLPLFSSGGSSVVTTFLTIGLVLSVYRKNKRTSMFD